MLFDTVTIMIDLREEALKQAKGLEYWTLKLGFTDIPSYACRNLHDFLNNKSSIGMNREVIVPRVVYFPHPETDGEKLCLPIKLRDETGEVDVYVRPHALHTETGRFLVNVLDDICQGDLLVYATLRNGYVDGTIFTDGKDDSVYLSGFWSPRIRNPQSGLNDLVSKLSSLIPDLTQPALVPVRK